MLFKDVLEGVEEEEGGVRAREAVLCGYLRFAAVVLPRRNILEADAPIES